MKKLTVLFFLLLGMVIWAGCADVAAQVETIAQQVDVESILTGVVENIDWDELKNLAEQGYDAVIERFPALKSENVNAFLKENGLKLMNKYLESTDPCVQENARKMGEIIKILAPELTDEVDSVIAE